MGVSLRPMVGPEISEFLVASRRGYLEERIAAGDDPAAAARIVDEMSSAMFPDDKPGPGHFLYSVDEDGKRIGSLWIGSAPDERPGEWWVWDIVIEESARGRGVGRETMRLAEREASANGATGLGLTVFGHNPIARHLYESLGYHVVSMRMSKTI